MAQVATEPTVNLYEGLFLLNQAATASDFAGCIDHLKEVFNRAEAEVVAMKKWDDRRLAYEIKGQRRGTFILVHFNARSSQIANIERDVNLSELIFRALILKGDHIGETELEAFKNDGSLHTEELLRSDPAEAEAEAETESETPADDQVQDSAEPTAEVAEVAEVAESQEAVSDDNAGDDAGEDEDKDK